jgi:hypothetical protein
MIGVVLVGRLLRAKAIQRGRRTASKKDWGVAARRGDGCARADVTSRLRRKHSIAGTADLPMPETLAQPAVV